MIIYDLSCDNNHRFEGWFRSADDFESQQLRRLVRCPQCDSATTRRIPSAVAIGGQHQQAEQGAHTVLPEIPTSSGATAAAPIAMQLASAYRQMVQAIVAGSEDVGTAFADEARKIHYHEAPERAIRGQASPDECEALLDEGIEIVPLPNFKGGEH